MITIKTLAIPVTAVGLLLVSGLILATTGTGEDGARQLIRVSAGSSLLLFALAWSASSLNTLLAENTWRPVLQARRRLGIAFALSHTVHLGAIIWLVEVAFNGDYSELGELYAGGVIYLFIYLMLLTSNDNAVKALGAKWWKRLHKVGGYLIWVGLTSSYVGGLIEVGAWYYWIYAPLSLALLFLRIAAYRTTKRVAHA